MRNIKWTRAHAVDVPEIDAEHKALLRWCGDFDRAVTGGASTAQLQSIYRELAKRTAAHFAHEEREMRAGRYSLYAWHRRQHQAAVAKMETLGRSVRRGDRETTSATVECVAKWLNDHIRLADRMFGAYLRNRQRAIAARTS
ncbi:MAG: bacteriohemerythrin [Bryobacteraceae bacterium]